MSGHVFRRSTVPNPPVAVAARGSTIVDADGREYLDAAGGAVVVNVGHGRREIADALGGAGRPPVVCAWLRLHQRAARAVRGRGRRAPARWTTRTCTRCRAGPRPSRAPSSWPAPPSSPAARWIAAWSSPAGGATTATRLGALDLSGSQAAPPAVRAVAGQVPARLRRVPVPRWRARLPGPGDRRGARRRARGRDRRGRRVQRGRLRGRADRGGHAGRRGAAGGLLAGHRGGLPAARRAADRRRGHDRVRADRGLVRDGPLRRPAGHAGRGQGRDVRVLAVRVRGGIR